MVSSSTSKEDRSNPAIDRVAGEKPSREKKRAHTLSGKSIVSSVVSRKYLTFRQPAVAAAVVSFFPPNSRQQDGSSGKGRRRN